MNALQQFKQKGRILRKHLAQALNTEVKLSTAYEAVAVMEGATNWNEFSAKLANTKADSILAQRANGSVTLVVDTHLGKPENAELVRKICQAAWEHAVDDWKQLLSKGNCTYIIESTNIFNAMSDFNVVSTGEDGYSDEAERVVEDALHDLGYGRQSLLLYEGVASIDEPFHGVAPFSTLEDGEEFTLPGGSGQYRKVGVHRAVLLGADPQMADALYFEQDQDVCLQKKVRKQVQSKDYLVKVNLPGGVTGEANRLGILEVNLGDVLEEYDAPDDVEEWIWVEKNHSFAHKGNGEEGGVWEFMVRTEAGDKAPERLKPFFTLAKQSNAPWIMFHQG